MCIKKEVKLINHDCLPIFKLLYIMFAYLMLHAAFSNAACLHNAYFLSLIFADAFCYHAFSWFIYTYFVYFKYYFASCIVHLISWLSYFHVHIFFHSERAMCSLKIKIKIK